MDAWIITGIFAAMALAALCGRKSQAALLKNEGYKVEL